MLVFICNREGKRTQVLESGGVNITGGDEKQGNQKQEMG